MDEDKNNQTELIPAEEETVETVMAEEVPEEMAGEVKVEAERGTAAVSVDEGAEGPSEEAAETPAEGEIEEEPVEEAEGGFSFVEMLDTVPEVVKNYLLSDELAAKRKQIFEERGLSENEKDIALFTELEVFFGDIELDDFPDELWSRLPWEDGDEERARKLTLDILGQVMLPAQAQVGDVTGLITELGGKVEDYPSEQLEIRQVSFKEGVEEIISGLELSGLDEDMRNRLRHIIDSHLRGVRDDMETGRMLTKPKKVGGIELTEEQAAAIVDVMKDRMRMTRFVEVVEQRGVVAEAKKEWSVEEIKEIYAGSAEEREEISKHRSEIVQQLEVGGVDIRNVFYDIINPPDLLPPTSSEVVAGLLVLANEDQLTAALNDDERYREVVRKYYEGRGNEAGFAEFEKDVNSPQSLNVFLQTVLRGYGSLDEQNSARLCLRVLNLLKKRGHAQYAELAAFDMDEGRFVWNQPIEM